VSGFSPDWLALREPADHRARNRDLLARLEQAFSGHDSVTVLDLGCGAGSNLRATAPYLPLRQRWILVDHDDKLLAAAGGRLASWADSSECVGEDLALTKDGRELTVAFVQADLAAGIDGPLERGPDLVTAAALFDLVSQAWIERFARAVVARHAAFYTALTYNGTETWQPATPFEDEMLAAFHAHQGRDKGFGPSAGPQASDALTRDFLALGYDVATGDSPWKLGAQDEGLVTELAQGFVQAVRETGQVADDHIDAWLQARSSGASCTIGHTDLLALPR
jgi:SAM-dependent methyltransferase